MKIHFYWLVSLVFMFFAAAKSVAQQQHHIEMHSDSVLLLQGGLNTLDIQLENSGDTDFEGSLQLDVPKELSSLNGNNISVKILAGKKRFLSIKLRGSALSGLKGQQFTMRLLDRNGNILRQNLVRIEVQDKRTVIIQDNSDIQYLRNVGDSIFVKIRAINTGTTDEQIRIVFSSPDRIGDREFRIVSMLLPSGADSLVQMSFSVERYMLQLAQYTVRVTGIYDNSDVFGNISILFSNIASSRNYQQMFNTDNNLAVYSRNYVDLEATNVLERQPIYYLRSEGEYRLYDGKIRYGTFVSQMGGFESRPNINNTFLEYEKNNTTLTLGNIQESLEAPLYGRGIKVAVQGSLRSNMFSAGIVERSNDLLGFYNIGNPGLTAFTRVILADQVPDRKRYEGQLYYDNNGLDSTESILWANTFDIVRQGIADKVQLIGFVGAGANRYWGHRNGGADDVQPSMATGIKLNARINGWSFSSDNFFSTAYYTGNRRGAVQLSQRINRVVRKVNYGLGYFYSQYEPEFLNMPLVNYKNSMSRLDFSAYVPLSSFVSLNIQPAYNREQGSYWIQNGTVDLSTALWQLNTALNLRSGNLKHNLFLTTETGVMSIDHYTRNKFVLKANMSYNYGAFGLFGFYQKGAFMVYEVLNSILLDRAFGDRLSVGGSYNGHALHRKIIWNANVMANITRDFGNSFTSNINASYRIRKNTLLTTVVQYNYTKGITGYDFDYTNLRIGVRQNLKSQNLDAPRTKTGNLRVFCFFDHNNNGIYDEGDEVANDYGFMVRNVLFVTDRKGNSSFKKMPYGDYLLFFPLSKGYQAVSSSVTIDRRELQIEVPLQKVGIVKGRVSLEYDPNLSLPTNTNLDVYRVVAMDRNGKTFDTQTNESGIFLLNLPNGEYNIYLDTSSFPEHVSGPTDRRLIHIEAGKTIELDSFELKVETKTIEVKRFGTK